MNPDFNLVDHPWISITDVGHVSLRQLFSNPEYLALSGNPIQKIALLKLLLAIAQAAATPVDECAWRDLGTEGLAEACLAYLDHWHDRFYLYGQKPFLQMPAVAELPCQKFGRFIPETVTGNTTLLFQTQREPSLDDARRTVLLVTLMGFGLAGGSSAHNALVLTPGYRGKDNGKGRPVLNHPGPLIGHNGFLHVFLMGKTLHKTLWVNLFTKEQIDNDETYSGGIGTPPWEKMPSGEDCETAREIKHSLIGRLVPMSRFCLLSGGGIRCTEGILYEQADSPSIAIKPDGKPLLTSITVAPWRHFANLIGGDYYCPQIHNAMAHNFDEPLSIWAGGLHTSYSSGQQFLSGNDDYFENINHFPNEIIASTHLQKLKNYFSFLEKSASRLYINVLKFFKELKSSRAELHAKRAQQTFWELCRREVQNIFYACEGAPDELELQARFIGLLMDAYDRECPSHYAMDLYVKHAPDAGLIFDRLS